MSLYLKDGVFFEEVFKGESLVQILVYPENEKRAFSDKFKVAIIPYRSGFWVYCIYVKNNKSEYDREINESLIKEIKEITFNLEYSTDWNNYYTVEIFGKSGKFEHDYFENFNIELFLNRASVFIRLNTVECGRTLDREIIGQYLKTLVYFDGII